MGELSSSQKKSGKASRRASGPPPTRWEKAVIALSSVTTQVVKVDPDGVDIVCFGGDEDADWYRNVKHTKHLEEMVSDKRPKGACAMGAAMNEAIDDAFDKDLTKCPCAIMVLTAGRPDDTDELNTALMKAVTRLADTCETMPLTVTFVQIGNDSGATEYLASLDDSIKAECAANGETFDLVDTIKHADIDAAIFGAFAGAALGVGGMYIYNKHQAKKRTAGWGGKWQVTYDGEEICVLNVTDDEAGNLVIDGLPSGDTTTGAYSVPSEDEDMEDEEFEYTIEFKDPSGDFNVEGTVEDEHAITWSDGTRWDEMDQDGAKMVQYAAAAAGGAAAVGATGYLLDKQFFNKASKGDQCDYIILMDRSAQMNIVDSS